MSSAPARTRPIPTLDSARAGRRPWSDYLALSKPRVTGMVMLTALAVCYVGERRPLGVWFMLHLMVGTGLLAAGTAALNQLWERETDGVMRRTSLRPLPGHRLVPLQALLFGLSTAVLGLLELALRINPLTAALGLGTSLVYLLAYTPLKSRSPISTVVGALPGASPILMGWAAARQQIDAPGWALFGIQLLWQFPHFLAIAWLYKEDYERAGICMLPVVDAEGVETGHQMRLYTLTLLPVSLLPTLLGIAGTVYFLGALLLGVAFLACAWRTAAHLTKASSRLLLQASVLYLPLLFVLLALDKR